MIHSMNQYEYDLHFTLDKSPFVGREGMVEVIKGDR